MHPKTIKKKDRSSRRSKKQPQQFSLKRLSNLLDSYSTANGEGAIEKLSRLAEQIVEVIAQNRKRRSPSLNYYRRRIE